MLENLVNSDDLLNENKEALKTALLKGHSHQHEKKAKKILELTRNGSQLNLAGLTKLVNF